MTEERMIIAVRTFDAPRELVWRMFERPEHIAQWWGPNGFTITIDAMDFKPAGHWRFVMHGPDGRDYQNHNVFREIVKPERIVYQHVSAPVHEATITLEDLGGRTRVTFELMFESVELRNAVAKTYGAVEGLKQNLEKLDEYVRKADLVIDRLFDAPRELVFKAWTDPKQLAKWWGPAGFTNPRCEADARPGGAIHIDMRAPDGTTFPMKGTFLEVVAPERLVFSAIGAEDPQGRPLLETFNVVSFADERGKTRLHLEVRVTKLDPSMVAARAGMSAGWSQSIDKLDTLVSGRKPLPEFTISRTFDARRELVWKAWTEPERMARWFGPKGVKVVQSKNDLRPGGTYHYALKTADGTVMWGKWSYIDIVSPDRLVFISSFSDEHGGVTRHPLNEQWPLELLSAIIFTEEKGRTTVTVHWSPINATAVERETFDKGRESMTGGWTGTFEALAEYLAGTR